MQKLYLTGLAATAVLIAGPAAHANDVSATLSATYFQVFDGTDPDFNHDGLTPNVADGSLLGAHGMPVVSPDFGVSDVLAGTNELTWWDPAHNSNVFKTGTGTITLPYSNNAMYPQNSTGSYGDGDGTAFETAIFTGVFTLASSATVEFQLGSDDDSFIYVDGKLFGQNPGIHAISDVDFTSPTLSAGTHTLEVFFSDRQDTGSEFDLNLLSDDVVISAPPGVPEPASWALVIAGFGLAGAALRRRMAVA